MRLIKGDCLDVLKTLDTASIDLIYLDPPFFTQKIHSLITRDFLNEYTFEDTWESIEQYIQYIQIRLTECHRVLKNTGSIFLHCDKFASHHLRVCLDNVFGYNNFQSEIIWFYKRWSNSKKGLLNGHQNIYFYSKSSSFTFNTLYQEYSSTTNVDQILQERVRNEQGKSSYKKKNNGEIVLGKEKKGVPLSDVWEIPFLNPKAKERVGYPTQKPIILLERIIQISTNKGDIVLDPFAGSGTTLVASELLQRKYIGIDISDDAINLCRNRLENIVKTESLLLKNGKSNYQNLPNSVLEILKLIDATPVQRNLGIDGFLKIHFENKPVSVKVQRDNESLDDAVQRLIKASKNKCSLMILIKTNKNELENLSLYNTDYLSMGNLFIISSYDLQINDWLDKKVCSEFKSKSSSI